MRFTPRLLAGAALAAAFLAASVGWAETAPPAEGEAFEAARAEFEAGLALARAEDWAAALERFDASLALSPTAVAQYNRSTCLTRLRRFGEAIASLRDYLERYADEIDPERQRAVRAEIERLEGLVGSLTVAVERPEGAAVLVDGREVGRAPLEAPIVLEAGPHELEVRAEGFAPMRRRVVVAGGAHVEVVTALLPEGSPGNLLVAAALPGATVSVDGIEVGATPLAEPLIVTSGRHRVEARRPGYRPFEAEVEVPASGVARVEVDLAPLAALPAEVAGRLAVAASEPGAEVLVDGHPFGAGALPAGPHRLEVRLEGFEPHAEELSVEAGAETRLEVALRPTPTLVRAYEARAAAFRLSAYVVGSVGLAALATTLGLYLWNSDRSASYDEERAFLVEHPDVEERDRRWIANEDLRESVETVDAVDWALLAVGAAATVTGVAIFFAGPRPGRYGRVAVAPGPGSLTLVAGF